MEKEDDGMAKAFGVCLGGVFLLAMGASFLQWAGPIVARTLSQFEQHLGSILAIVVVVVLLYAYVKIKVARIRGRGRGVAVSTPQPAFAFHPGRDRPGLIGSIGRYLSERRGGPVIFDGGRPLHVFQPHVEEIDEDEEDDEPAEREHQYTTEEARRIYQAAVAEKRRAKRVRATR